MAQVNRSTLVKVKYLDEALKCYGEYGFYSEEKALLGEMSGKWKIIRSGSGQTYETQVMAAEKPNEIVLTKADLPGPDFNEQNRTKNVKKKRIAWVQDNIRVGGAELTNKECVRKGIDCGFEIQIINSNTVFKSLSQFDLIILNNLWAFNPDQMRVILSAVYSDMIPYVKFEHDHRELDRPEFSRALFQNSRLNIFLSPVHLKNHQERLGCDGICLPLAIDCAPFLNGQGEIKREVNTAIVCNLRNFKSWSKLQKYVMDHPDVRFDILAKDPVVTGNNVRAIPMVSFEEMPGIYRTHESVVHLLDGWGAGERVIFEGALSGCKIVSDERAGHMSWERDLADIQGLTEWLTQAPYDFWKRIEEIV